MVRYTLFSALVAMCLTGCGASPTTGLSSETQRKTKELYEAMKKDTQKKLDEMDKKLAEWKDKVDKASGDAKAKMESKYNELKAQRDKFADKVNEFGKATGDAWEKLKEGLEKSASEAGEAFEKAANEFK